MATTHERKVARQSGTAEQRQQLAALRRAGVSLPACGRQLGVSYQTAQRWWAELLEQLAKDTALETKFARERELDRLDHLLQRAWAAAHPAGGGFNKEAVLTCLKLIECRARICGLFSPDILALTQINVSDDTDEFDGAYLKLQRLMGFLGSEPVNKALPAIEGELATPQAAEPMTSAPAEDNDLGDEVLQQVPATTRHKRLDEDDDRRKALRGAQVIDSRGGLTGTGQWDDDDDRVLDRPNHDRWEADR